MRQFIVPILLLLGSNPTLAADQPPVKKQNPYLPSGTDLPLGTGPEGELDPQSEANKTPPSRKWIEEHRNVKKGAPEVKKDSSKVPLSFGTTCKENGKLYKATDDYYATCLENHRRTQEKIRADRDTGKLKKGSMEGSSDVSPGVELKIGE